MKKVAILTQPLHINNGGTLQAYALQQVIQSLGYDVKTINYQWKKQSDFLKLLSTIKHKILKNKKIYHFSEAEINIIMKKHRLFIEKNINYTHEIYELMELKEYFKESNFDIVVVGSDQVWRLMYSPRIESFFLDFLSENNRIKKISYAASFGVDYWEYPDEITNTVKNLIKNFDFVSVRESSGVELCKSKLEIKAEHVLDPTLLLSKEKYLSLCDFDDYGLRSGVFSYILDNNMEKENILKEISKCLEKEIFTNKPNKVKKENFIEKNLDQYIYPSIEGWIMSFEQADFIVTDSFHGMVFSIIFNKPFLVIINKERGASRFLSLLKELDLQDRILNDLTKIQDKNFLLNVDYCKVNLTLDRLKKISLNQLDVALVG